jgi:hypothetical protein
MLKVEFSKLSQSEQTYPTRKIQLFVSGKDGDPLEIK